VGLSGEPGQGGMGAARGGTGQRVYKDLRFLGPTGGSRAGPQGSANVFGRPRRRKGPLRVRWWADRAHSRSSCHRRLWAPTSLRRQRHRRPEPEFTLLEHADDPGRQRRGTERGGAQTTLEILAVLVQPPSVPRL